MKKGVWVAVPAYTGQICIETVHSLNVEMIYAFDRGRPFVLSQQGGHSIISMCRNMFAMEFLASDPDEFSSLIFVDSDVAFQPGDLLKLADYPRDIVGGVYPFRKDPLKYPVKFISGEPPPPDPETGLIKVAGLPTGFLKISRAALELIMAKFPDYWYHDESTPQKKAWRFFEFIIKNNMFYGEDYGFCALARECGLDIWCDPNLTLTHVGPKKFTANMKQSIDSEKAPLTIIDSMNERSVA